MILKSFFKYKNFQKLILLQITLLVFISAGCGKPGVIYDPFKVPRSKFYPKLKNVALFPTRVPEKYQSHSDVLNDFSSYIKEELEERDIQAIKVGVQRADSLKRIVMEELEGLYDPYTGKIDSAKATRWRTLIINEVSKSGEFDAILFFSVIIVGARFHYDDAEWDGASESVGKDKFLKFLGGESHSGVVPALSLLVELRSMKDTLLYLNAGGIQVLNKIGAFGSEPEEISDHELLSDQNKLEKAVEYAINPLLGIEKRTLPGSVKKPDPKSSLMDSDN